MDFNAYLFLVYGVGILYVIGLDISIFQCDTFGNLLQVVRRYVLVEEDVIDFLLEELGMCELRCQVAVVGKQ